MSLAHRGSCASPDVIFGSHSEACKAFVPGVTTGWETLEKAAEQANIL